MPGNFPTTTAGYDENSVQLTYNFTNFFAGCTSLNHIKLKGYNIFGQSHINTTNWLTPDNLPDKGTFECTEEMWSSLSSSLASIFETKGWNVIIK